MTPGEPATQPADDEQDAEHGELDAGQDVEDAQEPGQIGNYEDAQRYRQAESSVLEPGEQVVGEREYGKADDLGRKQPHYDVQHETILAANSTESSPANTKVC